MNGKLVDLRQEFDAAFASPLGAGTAPSVDLLAVTVAGDPYALRVCDIARLSATRTIVPLPGRRTELLGLTGLRGAIVPVYSLALVMGYPATGEGSRWLVTCGRPFTIAFAFEQFQRHLRVPATAISHAGPADGRPNHVDELVSDGTLIRGVINLASAVRAMTDGALQEGRTSR
jgi:chemotaxis signal transduction protein